MAIYDSINKSWVISIGINGITTLYLSELLNYPEVLKYNVDNSPTDQYLFNLNELINNVYEPICQYYNNKIPVFPSYISENLNQYLMVDTSSQHFLGEAIDIDISVLKRDKSNSDLFYYIKSNINFDKLIWEFGDNINPKFVHVSYNINGNSGEILKINQIGQNYIQFELKPTFYQGFI
mgnify:CR=1 FL=1